MYKKLDVMACSYNPNSSEEMPGSLPKLASQPVHLTPEAVLWLPHACSQMCVSIWHARVHSHTVELALMYTLELYGKLSDYLGEANPEGWLRG